MKQALTIVVSALLALALNNYLAPEAYAHPGNTASDGCHYCRTNCDKWGVPWNERHCHGGTVSSESSIGGNQQSQNSQPVIQPTATQTVAYPTQTPTSAPPIPTSTPFPTDTNTPTLESSPSEIPVMTQEVKATIDQDLPEPTIVVESEKTEANSATGFTILLGILGGMFFFIRLIINKLRGASS